MSANKTICVIEDNMPIRKLFSTLLRKNGFEVSDFPDAASALNWLKENNADIILMDILLPDMNGTELIILVRETARHINTPAIAVTGFASPHDKEKFIELGFNGYLAKPINTSTFVSEIENIINQ